MEQGNKPVYVHFSRDTYRDVDIERIRAHAKHGHTVGAVERAHWTGKLWLAILVEEVGEVAHELTYDADNSIVRSRALRAELVQVAAMACAWIEAIDDGDNRGY